MRVSGSVVHDESYDKHRHGHVLIDGHSCQSLAYDDYTIGWISALPLELTAARAILDEVHQDIAGGRHDSNSYTLGRVGRHKIAIACLPSGHYGTNNALIVATNLKRTFPSIEIGLVVGVGGGVPGKLDIRLGDVVVGNEVIQFDFGKTTQGGQFNRTSSHVRPQSILTAVTKLRSEPASISDVLSRVLKRHPHMTSASYPGWLKDQLFQSNYDHGPSNGSCGDCDKSKLEPREPRGTEEPEVHYGLIASGNQVIKDEKTRDYWAHQGVLCFEMEATGLVDHFPCLVVRGVCDYADSHKNKVWQPYATATATAYAKSLLDVFNTTRSQAPFVVGSTKHAISEDKQELSKISEDKIQDMLKSLRFEQMESRQMTIKAAHIETCEWVLSHPKYTEWLDPDKLEENHGFLWIKGKPGVGKSTLMKFIFQSNQAQGEEGVSINFFFNARGNNLERSVFGMYRSLLSQLLTKLPALKTVLNSLSSTAWTVEMLKDLFEQAISQLGGSPVTCFIDALDECNQEEVRDMISFFERMGKLATSRGFVLHVCLSSRHYPHITIKSGVQIVLEWQEGHAEDITKYISDQLNIGQSQLANDIRHELQHKSSGVFMWVVLVVEILNREYDDGYIHILQKRLREIPSDLHKLFRDILTRDDRHRLELRLCL